MGDGIFNNITIWKTLPLSKGGGSIYTSEQLRALEDVLTDFYESGDLIMFYSVLQSSKIFKLCNFTTIGSNGFVNHTMKSPSIILGRSVHDEQHFTPKWNGRDGVTP